MSRRKTLTQLLETDLSALNDTEKLDAMAVLFDYAANYSHEKSLEKGLSFGNHVDIAKLSLTDQAKFHFFMANGWNIRRQLDRNQQPQSWDYDQQELTHEMYHLRSSLNSAGFILLDQEYRCRVLTNLGNLFSHLGRLSEAQQVWQAALEIDPKFAMALANMGRWLVYYAARLFDETHRNIFIYHSYHYLHKAIGLPRQLTLEAIAGCREIIQDIAKRYPATYLQTRHDFNHFDLGDDRQLRPYREWCLKECLYINTMNDLGPYTCSSQDSLQLPSIVVNAGEPPKYHTLFNQIKQEYGTARFLFYEGRCLAERHYADEDIRLTDTLEDAEYAYNLEKVKIAYRLIYSLFDKLAYLLNDYLKVGMKRDKVSFRTLWHQENKKPKVLRPCFQNNTNLALRGLFWLSKDLFNPEDNDAYSVLMEPESQELGAIRNHIEHKSFRVAHYGNWGENDADDFTYSIDRKKFELKTIKLIRLARAAIIYTALAVHHHEKLHPKGPALPVTLPNLPNDEKI